MYKFQINAVLQLIANINTNRLSDMFMLLININLVSVAIKYNPIVLQPNAMKTNQQFITFKHDFECAGACNKMFDSSNR